MSQEGVGERGGREREDGDQGNNDGIREIYYSYYPGAEIPLEYVDTQPQLFEEDIQGNNDGFQFLQPSDQYPLVGQYEILGQQQTVLVSQAIAIENVTGTTVERGLVVEGVNKIDNHAQFEEEEEGDTDDVGLPDISFLAGNGEGPPGEFDFYQDDDEDANGALRGVIAAEASTSTANVRRGELPRAANELEHELENEENIGPIVGSENVVFEDYEGPFEFHIIPKKEGKMKYSDQLQKLFVMPAACGFWLKMDFREVGSDVENYTLRIALLLEESKDQNVPVSQCVSCQEVRKSDPNNHVESTKYVVRGMKEDRNVSYYRSPETKFRYVIIKLSKPEPGCENRGLPINLDFTCLSSCKGGINRRKTSLVFTLLNKQKNVMGRSVLKIRICTAPQRDMKNEEEATATGNNNDGRKRKARDPTRRSGSGAATTRQGPMEAEDNADLEAGGGMPPHQHQHEIDQELLDDIMGSSSQESGGGSQDIEFEDELSQNRRKTVALKKMMKRSVKIAKLRDSPCPLLSQMGSSMCTILYNCDKVSRHQLQAVRKHISYTRRPSEAAANEDNNDNNDQIA